MPSFLATAVFQSAPLTVARGDSWGKWVIDGITEFQSAPLTVARGDLGHGYKAIANYLFQSAPLTVARGDLAGREAIIEQLEVSIRSPDRSQGRCPQWSTLSGRGTRFNPLP